MARLGRERSRASGLLARRGMRWLGLAVVSGALYAPAARGLTALRNDVTATSVAVEDQQGAHDPVSILGNAGPTVVRYPAPEPGLGPDAVVGIMLRALQHNDDPVADHGIAVTFAFTSPENRDITGPIDRFRALVKSSAFRPMIGHAKADRGPVIVLAEHARERVAITGANGERVVYLFLLSRQETGAYKGCWMADGVLREADDAKGLTPPALMTAVVFRQD